MSAYPATIVTYSPDVDFSTVVLAAESNAQWAEIVAIETVLGLNPATFGSGSHAPGTVGYNLDTLAAEILTLQTDLTELEGGTVVAVAATNISIVVTGTSTNPLISTATLDVIAATRPPVANWSNNGFKIQNVLTGTASGDAANVGQLPTLASLGALNKAGDTMSGPLAMGGNKVTGGAAATNPGDFVILSQLPLTATTILVVSGSTYTPNIGTTYKALINNPTAAFTVANPTGSPFDGQQLMLFITSSGTGYAPSWGTAYLSSGSVALPTAALPASVTCTFGFKYDAARTKWILLASDPVGY